MKHIFSTCLLASMAAYTSLASAENLEIPGEFSANVALTTDYIFRGISQADEDPALQGGIDYALDLGAGSSFYLGFWGSNVEQPDEDGSLSNLELDIYGGLSGEVNGIGWDIGVLYFEYPDSTVLDYIEYYGALSYSMSGMPLEPSLSAKVSYSPDFFAESGDGLYVEGALDLTLGYGFALGLHIGHQDIEENDVFGTPDYTDWRVGVTKTFAGIDFDISYYDTDLDESECFGGSDLCDERAVFTVSKSF